MLTATFYSLDDHSDDVEIGTLTYNEGRVTYAGDSVFLHDLAATINLEAFPLQAFEQLPLMYRSPYLRAEVKQRGEKRQSMPDVVGNYKAVREKVYPDYNDKDQGWKELVTHGGPGSGDFGHSGRPGKVGGSSDDAGSVVLKPIHTQLLDAHKSLTQLRENEDGLVSVVDMFNNARHRVPSLTITQFHEHLKELRKANKISLHVLNEVRGAKEPHKLLREGDDVFGYVSIRKQLSTEEKAAKAKKIAEREAKEKRENKFGKKSPAQEKLERAKKLKVGESYYANLPDKPRTEVKIDSVDAEGNVTVSWKKSGIGGLFGGKQTAVVGPDQIVGNVEWNSLEQEQ